MQPAKQKPLWLFKSRPILGAVAWVIALALWGWFVHGDVASHEWLPRTTESPLAALVFVMVTIMATVLLLPGIVITVSAGYLFGLTNGIMLIVVGTTAGASIAFWLGHHVFKQALLQYLDNHHPLLFDLNDGLRAQGGLVVFLTRLIPFFPFKLSNYYFGAARYRMPSFVIGTFLGIIPITALNVYVGVALSRIGLHTPPLTQEPTISLWITLIGGAALVCLVALISRQAVSSLKELRNAAVEAQSNPPKRHHV